MNSNVAHLILNLIFPLGLAIFHKVTLRHFLPLLAPQSWPEFLAGASVVKVAVNEIVPERSPLLCPSYRLGYRGALVVDHSAL